MGKSMSTRKRKQGPISTVRLEAGQLVLFKWNNNTCEVAVRAPRVGFDTPELWANKPDVTGRPPHPDLRAVLNTFEPFCYKHREAAKVKGGRVVVTGIQVKYQDDNWGIKIFAHVVLKNKPGQVVNFDTPGFVWKEHRENGLRLTSGEVELATSLMEEVMQYASGHKSSQLSLLEGFEAATNGHTEEEKPKKASRRTTKQQPAMA
jgi:hypothetical protein